VSEEQAAKQTRESREADMNTTPPNPPAAPAAGWKMPEPVFRKTSGYLPQGYENKFSQADVKRSVEDDISTASMPRPENAADVQPQPAIPDTDEMKLPVMNQPVTTAPRKGGGSKVVFILLALIIAVGMVGAALVAAYFLYPLQTPVGPFE